MKLSDSERIREETVLLLEQALRGAVSEAQNFNLQTCRRRRWCGLSIMVSACLCLAFAAALWPIYGQMERFLWIFFCLLLFLFGVYQIAQASKTEKGKHGAGSHRSPPECSIHIVH